MRPLAIMAAQAEAEAEASVRAALFRCHVRERGIRVVGPGPLPLPGVHSPAGLVVDVTHASPAGHHRFGPDVRTATGAPISHGAVVAGLLGEDPYGIAEVVADSAARTARHLAVAAEKPWPPTDPERALLRGHPFHPTAKSAEGFDDADLAAYAPEQGAELRLHLVAVHPDLVAEHGRTGFDVLDGTRRGGLGDRSSDHWPVLPVHPWQAAYLEARPPTDAVTVLRNTGRLRFLGPVGPRATPTSSVRTVVTRRGLTNDNSTGPDHTQPSSGPVWKLPLHVRLTHFVRTNPPDHLRRAVDASALIARRRPGWRHPGFGVLVETGWRGVDAREVGDDRAADLAVLVREPPPPGSAVLAGLLAEGPRGEPPPLLARVRATGAGSAAWLRRHLAVATIPLLRIFDTDGIGLEAHVQNVLVGDDDGWPARLRVRDMEGVHVDRTRAHGLPCSSPVLYDPEEAWRRLRYHAIVNHLGHLVATLGFFGDTAEGELWGVVADELAAAGTPSATALTREATLPAKANLASRLAARGETPDYVEIDNPIRGARSWTP